MERGEEVAGGGGGRQVQSRGRGGRDEGSRVYKQVCGGE